jgi:4-methyl-5(b-hydroxyethyl)-thiazole monophosphate biosynthesis
MGKVYLFLANGFEEIEGLTVVDLLRRVGIEISMVSITGEKYVMGSHGIKIETDELFENLDYADSDMLVLPGGMPGTSHLSEHLGLTALLKEFNQKGKMIGAICAAPSILGINGILEGKTVTCYPGYEAKLVGANISTGKTEVDSNIITSKGMGTSIDFALAIVEYLKDLETANKLAEVIQYR